MEHPETLMLLRRASEEIRQLRAHLARIEPKAEAYDNIAAILRMMPKQSGGYGPDVLWEIEKHIAELMDPVPAAVRDADHG